MNFNRTYCGKKFSITIELPYDEGNCGYIKVENHPSEDFEYWESFTWYPFIETLDERLQDVEEEIKEFLSN